MSTSQDHVTASEDRFGNTLVFVSDEATQDEVLKVLGDALEKGKGIYVHLPLLSTSAVGSYVAVASPDVTWKRYHQTDDFNIILHDPTGKIPPASTSIQGAHAAIVTQDRKRVHLAKKMMWSGREGKMVETWTFVGGAVDDGETPHSALNREIREELGVSNDKFKESLRGDAIYLGCNVKADARSYGACEGHVPHTVADTIHFFGVVVDEEAFTAALGSVKNDGELMESAWFDLRDDGIPCTTAGEELNTLWSNGECLKRLRGATMLVDAQADGSALYWAPKPE